MLDHFSRMSKLPGIILLIQVLVYLAVAASDTLKENDGLSTRDARSPEIIVENDWKCPNITKQLAVECSCDFPHTLRCTGDKTALQVP